MTRLDEIVGAKRREAESLATPGQRRQLQEAAEKAPVPRGFMGRLRKQSKALIAEVKRASPSRGLLTHQFDPEAIAQAYERGGADAISVLTDHEFFGGSPQDLMLARASVRCPVLRKDFILNEAQVVQSRGFGADAILLIVRLLDDSSLLGLRRAAEALGMDVLVEAHTSEEVDRAVGAGARMIGVNNRDLDSFSVDLGVSERLREQIPPGILAVSESGVAGREDADRMYRAGYDAILVGEGIVRSQDREAAVRSLRPNARTGSVR